MWCATPAARAPTVVSRAAWANCVCAAKTRASRALRSAMMLAARKIAMKTTVTGLRPNPSDSGPQTSWANAKPAIATGPQDSRLFARCCESHISRPTRSTTAFCSTRSTIDRATGTTRRPDRASLMAKRACGAITIYWKRRSTSNGSPAINPITPSTCR